MYGCVCNVQIARSLFNRLISQASVTVYRNRRKNRDCLNQDSSDYADSRDFLNQTNQMNHRNPGSDNLVRSGAEIPPNYAL
jgi:hypothetical protein